MFVLLDIGGTRMRAACTNALDRPDINASDVIEIKTRNTYARDIESLKTAIRTLTDGRQIREIGMGVAGAINRERGMVARAPNMSSWDGKQPAKDLAHTFRCHAVLENDATMAALGEAAYGRAQGDFLYLTWGTGIGGTHILQRRRQFLVSSFEPGQIRIPRDNGATERLEMLVAGAGIKKQFRKAPQNLEKTEWDALLDTAAAGFASVLAVRPCDALIFTGGFVTGQPWIVRALHDRLKRILKTASIPSPHTVRASGFGDRSGLYGAAALLALPMRRVTFL